MEETENFKMEFITQKSTKAQKHKKITKLSFEMVLTNNFISFDKFPLFIYHRPVSNSTKQP